MSRPLYPESNLTKIAREQGRASQLERRPAPATTTAGTASTGLWGMGPFPMFSPSRNFYNTDSLGFGLVVATADKYGTWKWEATANSSYYVVGFNLGPYGSRWSILFDVEQGSDCGILAVDVATGSQNAAASSGYAIPDGLLESPYHKSATYTQFVSLFSQDCYNAATGVINAGAPSSAIDWRIKGTDGTTLTSVTGTDPDLGAGVRVANGGAGVWWFRVRVNGKNASSSAYRVSIRQMSVVRLTHDGFIA